ncbi:hypothetical protein [Terriglobus sp.]|uniref:hypothetical protein n=1 Tax=Terriglobus sp. TaxID=1889013 RepID=UPI003B001394
MLPNFRSLACGAALLATTVLSGCGPQFFSAKGDVSSDGGALRAWSRKPISCSRGVITGEPDKIVTFRFDLPPGFKPGRPGNQNAPEELAFAKSGSGTIGSLKVFAEVKQPGSPASFTQTTDGFMLDSSTCKTLTLDREEQGRGFGDSEKPLKGHLVLDCNVLGSHVTSDMTFKQCTF